MVSAISLLASCLVACSAATALALLPSENIHKRAVTVSDADFANFKLFAQYAAASYCNVANPGLLTCVSNSCPEVEAAKAVGTAEFLNKITDVAGFVAVDPTNNLIVVSFRGSNSVRTYLADVIFLMAPCNFGTGCGAHAGFLGSWESVKADTVAAVKSATAANPSFKLIITGHSLGAAIATLAGATLRDAGYACDIYTYGSPRVGNNAFANYVTAQAGSEFRVTHLDDPVPRLAPILLGYRHTSPEYWLSDGTSTTDNYTLADVKVCEGTANVQCNAGQGGFDTTAHINYLGPIQLCAANPIQFRDVDPETEYPSLVAYAALDVTFASALAADGSAPNIV